MDELDDVEEVIGVIGSMEEKNADNAASLEKSRLSTPYQGKYPKQAYRKAWENLPDFKGWLQQVDGQPSRAYCSYCRVTLFAHRLSLLKHTCTMKHQRASQKVWLLNKKTKDSERETAGSEVSPEFEAEVEPPPTSVDEFNPRGSKVQQITTLEGGMTVTIVQEGTDGSLKLKIDENVPETMDNSMIEHDDLTMNDSPVIAIIRDEEKESGSLAHAPAFRLRDPVARPVVMAHSSDYPLSTHVLDTSKGQPVPQLSVSLYRLIDGKWTLVNEGVTSQDGRCNKLIQKSEFVAGRYKLHFDTDRYFELDRKETLYPFVEIAFDVHAPHEHYHIPLLLSAYGYSTYRGS